MPITTTEYSFLHGGKLVRRDITEREIRVTPEMIQSLASDVVVRAAQVAMHEKWGSINLCLGSDAICWWTVRLPKLNIKAPWVMINKDLWVPELTDTSTPHTVMTWTPPINLMLAFLVPTICYGPGDVRKHGHSYLFAYFTDDMTTWRLPLGNLYDECRVCLGEENFADTTHMRCVAKVLDQFENAAWNADLWTTRVQTQKLFCFKPHNDGFDQVAVSNWTNLCKKVGNHVTEKIML